MASEITPSTIITNALSSAYTGDLMQANEMLEPLSEQLDLRASDPRDRLVAAEVRLALSRVIACEAVRTSNMAHLERAQLLAQHAAQTAVQASESLSQETTDYQRAQHATIVGRAIGQRACLMTVRALYGIAPSQEDADIASSQYRLAYHHLCRGNDQRSLLDTTLAATIHTMRFGHGKETLLWRTRATLLCARARFMHSLAQHTLFSSPEPKMFALLSGTHNPYELQRGLTEFNVSYDQ